MSDTPEVLIDEEPEGATPSAEEQEKLAAEAREITELAAAKRAEEVAAAKKADEEARKFLISEHLPEQVVEALKTAPTSPIIRGIVAHGLGILPIPDDADTYRKISDHIMKQEIPHAKEFFNAHGHYRGFTTSLTFAGLVRGSTVSLEPNGNYMPPFEVHFSGYCYRKEMVRYQVEVSSALEVTRDEAEEYSRSENLNEIFDRCMASGQVALKRADIPLGALRSVISSDVDRGSVDHIINEDEMRDAIIDYAG